MNSNYRSVFEAVYLLLLAVSVVEAIALYLRRKDYNWQAAWHHFLSRLAAELPS